MQQVLTTNQKALQINLNPQIYGTFAEIGAGQEVANLFFKAGGASGTIAKSMSAYDMTFSDSIYGKEKSGRYVCQSRVDKMIDHEYSLLIERLSDVREDSLFFAYANTVEARNYAGTNRPHGWIGFAFQHTPSSQPSKIILHVKMFDNTNVLQQKALGILGVNLIWNCFHNMDNYESFVNSLMDNLSQDRLEIDMIHIEGEGFKNFDSRLMNLQLVKSQITDAIIFNSDGGVALARDAFYKKDVLVVRGSYRPPTVVNLDILKTGLKNFSKVISKKEKDILTVAEITVNQLSEDGEITDEDFLARVTMLNTLGKGMMISNFRQYYRLSDFFSAYKVSNLGIVLGAYNFKQIFDSNYTQDDPGAILTVFGHLFKANAKLLIYPYKEEKDSDELINSSNIPIANELKGILDYIRCCGRIHDIEGYDSDLLHIYSRRVLKMIRENHKGWEEYVPSEVVEVIKSQCLFGACDY